MQMKPKPVEPVEREFVVTMTETEAEVLSALLLQSFDWLSSGAEGDVARKMHREFQNYVSTSYELVHKDSDYPVQYHKYYLRKRNRSRFT